MLAHKILALLLISVVVVSSLVVVYGLLAFTPFLAAFCPANTVPFRENSMPPGTVYQVAAPGRVTVCFTGRIWGSVPVEGISLVPSIGLYHSNATEFSYASCLYGADCGGVSVSASPAHASVLTRIVLVVATINVPAGSTLGYYLIFFAPGCTSAVLSLRIGQQNQSGRSGSVPAPLCPFPVFGMQVTFNTYAGMIPVSQNATIPIWP